VGLSYGWILPPEMRRCFQNNYSGKDWEGRQGIQQTVLQEEPLELDSHIRRDHLYGEAS
jgi:hypothetical protein